MFGLIQEKLKLNPGTENSVPVSESIDFLLVNTNSRECPIKRSEQDRADRGYVKNELEKIRHEIGCRTEYNIETRKAKLQERLKDESQKALATGDYTGMRRIKNELAFINDTAPEKKPIELKTLLIMKHIFGKKVGRREVEDFLLNNSHADPIELLNCGIDQLAEKCDAVIRTANQS